MHKAMNESRVCLKKPNPKAIETNVKYVGAYELIHIGIKGLYIFIPQRRIAHISNVEKKNNIK